MVIGRREQAGRMKLVVVLMFLFATNFLAVFSEEKSEEEEYDDESEELPPEGPPLMPMCELVESKGFKCEEHIITSKDGYKLELYHIPPASETPGPPVLLVHGLFASGECWVLKNNSIGYQLSEQGNDVWIMALRGTIHGRKHETLNPDTDEKFWDYSWQDMAFDDVPTGIAYVKEKTKSDQIYYIGHSMGTTIFMTMSSAMPEIADSIKGALLLAPVFYTGKYKFMLSEGSSMDNMTIETMDGFKKNQLWEAFPRADLPKNEHQITCEKLPDMVVAYCGMVFDMSRPHVGDFMPAGSSRKTLMHYYQSYLRGKIKFFDYGPEENNKRYGSPTPTDIDATKVKAPLHTFWCESDHLVASDDVKALNKELPNLKTAYFVDDDEFNHVDYLFPMSEDTEKSFDSLMTKIKEIVKA